MRITGGILSGRSIRIPAKWKIRPTQEKVRAALFSILGNRVVDARFLDLFAGSGAVGLEAWSRGAESVCWVEGNRKVFSVLKGSVEKLCVEDGVPFSARISVICSDVDRFLKKGLGKQFDIVFADPPYAARCSAGGEAAMLIDAISKSGILADDGVLILEERAGGREWNDREGWQVFDNRTYGDTSLRFLSAEQATNDIGGTLQ